jgi:Amt family ammonium transporter
VAYLIFTFVLVGFIYPVVLSWTWGNGWLAQAGFHDFAGTAIIHIIGGAAGLWGAIIVGPRYNRWRKVEQGPSNETVAISEAL